jgi:predicted N-acetyltransferase YhbS
LQLVPFDPEDAGHVATAALLWAAACGPELAIHERSVRFNTAPLPGVARGGRWALDDYGTPVGLVLASLLRDDPSASPPEVGYVDLLAVHPVDRRAGTGTALLAWSETWLSENGCATARLGGSLRPFAPGLPLELGTEGFFRARGYAADAESPTAWDVAADLGRYAPSGRDGMPGCSVRPARSGEEDDLLGFFSREFPGRWRREFEEGLHDGASVSDYLVLVTEQGIGGFAHATYEDSHWPLDRVFPARLPRPWAQLGPLGVSAGLRGRGLGGALMDGALQHLAARGVRVCVIDWTTHVDFYRKFGFVPYRQYGMLGKRLGAS